MHVKLTDDPSRAKVRGPHGGRLLQKDEVREVGDHDPYWLRRVAQRDVLRVDKDGAALPPVKPPQPEAAAEQPPAAEPEPPAAPAPPAVQS